MVRTAEQIIKGFPAGERARARTVFKKAQAEAVIKLQQAMNSKPQDTPLSDVVAAWAREILKDEDDT